MVADINVSGISSSEALIEVKHLIDAGEIMITISGDDPVSRDNIKRYAFGKHYQSTIEGDDSAWKLILEQ